MRTIGIAAIFVLSLCAIGEGAYLIKLSRRVNALSQQVERGALEGGSSLAYGAAQPADERPRKTLGAAEAQVRVAAPVPNFQTLAPASTTPATSTLREALSTSEGREQLKAALAVIEEEKRQARMLERAGRSDERDKRWKERIAKSVALTGDEPLKIESLFTSLGHGRRQILDEMKAGAKNAEQADDAIDELEEATERSVRALMGEERWRKFREDGRRNRQQGQGQGQAGPPAPGQPGAPGQPPGAPGGRAL